MGDPRDMSGNHERIYALDFSRRAYSEEVCACALSRSSMYRLIIVSHKSSAAFFSTCCPGNCVTRARKRLNDARRLEWCIVLSFLSLSLSLSLCGRTALFDDFLFYNLRLYCWGIWTFVVAERGWFAQSDKTDDEGEEIHKVRLSDFRRSAIHDAAGFSWQRHRARTTSWVILDGISWRITHFDAPDRNSWHNLSD